MTEPQRPVEGTTQPVPAQPAPAVPAAVPPTAPQAAQGVPPVMPVPGGQVAPVAQQGAYAPPPDFAGAQLPPAPPLASVIAKPKSSTGRGTTLLMGLAAAIAIGGLAFAAGRMTAPAAASTGRGGGQFGGNGTGQVPGGTGGGAGFGGRGLGGGVSVKGTVTAISADSVTVKLASGASVTIPLNSSTTYHTASPSSAGAVAVGSDVSVTPGARTPNAASPDPNATPRPDGTGAPGFPGFGNFAFGPATDVTVVQP